MAGRLFDDHDVDTAPSVAIVDQTLAARFWPGSAIGRVVLVVVTGRLASVVAMACAVPAWRASRIDPRVALSD